MAARTPEAAEVKAAQAVYTPMVLAVYDWFVLGFSSRFAWRCLRSEMLAFYDQHIGARHLDIGVGTGFFLDHCQWPVARPELTLLDVNPHSLRAAARRTERFRPLMVQANVLDPLDLGEARFDSIGMNFLLHCLPGPPRAEGGQGCTQRDASSAAERRRVREHDPRTRGSAQRAWAKPAACLHQKGDLFQPRRRRRGTGTRARGSVP
jgi:SAM-dependent methyltransferase